MAAFSPDGRWLASASQGTVTIWDGATGQESLRLRGHGGSVSSFAFGPDGTRLASAGDGGVKVWYVRQAPRNPLTLKAGEEKIIPIHYYVEFPADLPVYGLE